MSDDSLAAADARAMPAVARPTSRWLLPAGIGGVLLLGRPNRGRDVFLAAIDFMDARTTRTLRDQSVLNHILHAREKFFLPPTYNFKVQSRSAEALADGHALKAAKVLHLVGRSKWLLKDPANAGQPIYEHFHALQARTGVPFVLDV